MLDPEFKKPIFHIGLLSFKSKIVPSFLNFLFIFKIGPELVLIPLGGHRECIEAFKTIVDYFCMIRNLKTCISNCFDWFHVENNISSFEFFIYPQTMSRIGSTSQVLHSTKNRMEPTPQLYLSCK